MSDWPTRYQWAYGIWNDPGPVGAATRLIVSSQVAETGAKLFGTFAGYRLRGGDPYTRNKKNMPPVRTPFRRLDNPYPTPGENIPQTRSTYRNYIANPVFQTNPFVAQTNTLQQKNNNMSSGAIVSRYHHGFSKSSTNGEIAQTYGSAKELENGVIAGSPNVKVLFLQLGTPLEQLVRAVFRAMVAALVHKHGIQFKNWDFQNGQNGRVTLYIRNRIEGVLGTPQTYEFTAGQSHRQIAQEWLNVVKASGIMNNGNLFDFYRIKLEYVVPDDLVDAFFTASEFYTENLDINIYQRYKIVCQNQTAADTESGLSTDVSNVNPVYNKTYYINGHIAALNVQDFGGFGSGGAPNFKPGTLEGYSDYATTTISGPNTMKKLPQSNVFQKCAKVTPKVNVLPGEMIERKVSKSHQAQLSSWLTDLNDVDGNLEGILPTEYACNMVLAFEKSLNTRGAETPGVSIGAQYEWFISAYCSPRKLKPTNKIVSDL